MKKKNKKEPVTRDLSQFAVGVILVDFQRSGRILDVVQYNKTTYPNGDVVTVLELT